MKPSCYGSIFARGGSKGVPGKNIRPLGGKPLIAHSIEALQGSESIDRIIVSTEDEKIASAARTWGAEVPFMRPAELARDDSPEIEAWRHALREAEREGGMPDVFVSAPATSPFRISSDIDQAIHLLLNSDADMVIAIAESTHNPYFNMVTLDEGRVRIALKSPLEIHRRQDAPPMFNITTVVYAVRPEYIFKTDHLLEGRVAGFNVPAERALDIDTMMDFEFAEFLIAKRGPVA